jgi:hypothetical protein
MRMPEKVGMIRLEFSTTRKVCCLNMEFVQGHDLLKTVEKCQVRVLVVLIHFLVESQP